MGWVVSTTPRPLYPGKDQVPIVQEAGWPSGPVWTGAEYLASHRDSIPGPSSPQRVAIPTELSRHFLNGNLSAAGKIFRVPTTQTSRTCIKRKLPGRQNFQMITKCHVMPTETKSAFPLMTFIVTLHYQLSTLSAQQFRS